MVPPRNLQAGASMDPRPLVVLEQSRVVIFHTLFCASEVEHGSGARA